MPLTYNFSRIEGNLFKVSWKSRYPEGIMKKMKKEGAESNLMSVVKVCPKVQQINKNPTVIEQNYLSTKIHLNNSSAIKKTNVNQFLPSWVQE